ncbi:MAG: hypothetical protein AAF999_05460 [Pseudomonadota bacterium]
MKLLIGLFLVPLVVMACAPLPQNSQAVSSQPTQISEERRALLNMCLAEAGKDPLPEVLEGMNAPMNASEGVIFKACMERNENA